MTEQKRRAPRTPIDAPPTATHIPAIDAADSDIPLKLSAQAVAGTWDRAKALAWMEEGHTVVKRPDGVYEQMLATEAEAAPTPAEEFADWPSLDVLERRLLDPNLSTSAPIRFKDEEGLSVTAKPKWYKRWIDTHIPSRLQTLTQRGGFRKATWDRLADRNEIGDRYEAQTGTDDQIVRRGEKGRYVLIYMPYVYWEQIKLKQTQDRLARERKQGGPVSAGEVASGVGPHAAEIMTSTDQFGRPGLIGSTRELPPMSPEAFQATGMPKDMAQGAVALED